MGGRDNPEFSEAVLLLLSPPSPLLLSFAFLTRNGKNDPEFSEIFYLLLLTSMPAPFFLLRFWKEMGWATPNFLKLVPSFTYQLPPPPNSILPFRFLERNRKGNPFKFGKFLHLQTCKDGGGGGGGLERIVKEMKIWIQKGQRCIINEVHDILSWGFFIRLKIDLG